MRRNSHKLSKTRKRKLLIASVVLVVLLVVFGNLALKFLKFSPVLFQLLFNREIDLKKSNHTLNILLLGTGGGSHDGPNLTDTIMVATLDQANNKATLISIPRDLWIPDLKAKVNTAYAFGEEKQEGGGIVLARAVVEKIIKKPIDYVIRVDFAGFVKAVDEVGGLDVDVENEFNDYNYPVEAKREDLCGHSLEEATVMIASLSAYEVFPCRYTFVHFDQGSQHMDGERALIFARSRYAQGIEGSDFARSKRQEKILKAFKDKVFSAGTLLNPARLISLYSILEGSIHTNIAQEEFDDFIRLAQKMREAEIQSIVLDYGNEEANRPGLLINPPISDEYELQWVLIPRVGNGNFTEIQNHITCVLSYKTCEIKPRYENSAANTQKSTKTIQN